MEEKILTQRGRKLFTTIGKATAITTAAILLVATGWVLKSIN